MSKMKFAAAMQAVANGKVVRRASWDAVQFVDSPHAEQVVLECTPVSAEVTRTDVRYFRPVHINGREGYGPFVPDSFDREANDWESFLSGDDVRQAAAAAQAEDDTDPADLLDPGSPTAETDAEVKDTGNHLAAPAGTQSAEQDPVSLVASGAPAATEDAAPVQEVMQDSGATTLADGIQKPDMA